MVAAEVMVVVMGEVSCLAISGAVPERRNRPVPVERKLFVTEGIRGETNAKAAGHRTLKTGTNMVCFRDAGTNVRTTVVVSRNTADCCSLPRRVSVRIVVVACWSDAIASSVLVAVASVCRLYLCIYRQLQLPKLSVLANSPYPPRPMFIATLSSLVTMERG